MLAGPRSGNAQPTVGAPDVVGPAPAPPSAELAEVPSSSALLSFDVHGFGAQGFLLSTGNEYLVPDSKRGSFQMSEVGLNLSKNLTERLRFGVQFFAQNFGNSGSYTPQIDWFTLDCRWKDWFGLRAGRLKIPYGLFNEAHDIDAGRLPILLPQSLYPQQGRSFLFAQTGAEVYGILRAAGAGALEYRLFAGTIFIDPKVVIPPGSPIQLHFNVPFVFGGRLHWETPLRGLRLGASLWKLRLDTTAFLPMGVTAGIENNSWSWIASAEYEYRALALSAEYARGYTKQETIIPGNNV
ncbi:MAG TPA: hypothetical protein VGG33_08985, partial [Polyangia bacterium]